METTFRGRFCLVCLVCLVRAQKATCWTRRRRDSTLLGTPPPAVWGRAPARFCHTSLLLGRSDRIDTVPQRPILALVLPTQIVLFGRCLGHGAFQPLACVVGGSIPGGQSGVSGAKIFLFQRCGGSNGRQVHA